MRVRRLSLACGRCNGSPQGGHLIQRDPQQALLKAVALPFHTKLRAFEKQL